MAVVVFGERGRILSWGLGLSCVGDHMHGHDLGRGARRCGVLYLRVDRVGTSWVV